MKGNKKDDAKERTVEVSFDSWLASLDCVIAANNLIVKDNKEFARQTDLLLAMDRYINDPENKSPLIAIMTSNALEVGQFFSLN